MGFKSPLDVSGFVGSLEQANKCKKCGRDNRVGADTSRIRVLESCSGCGKPLVWEKTDYKGTYEYEWVNGKGIVTRKSKDNPKARVRIEID